MSAAAADPPAPLWQVRQWFTDALQLVPGLKAERRLLALVLLRRTSDHLFQTQGALLTWIGVGLLSKALGKDRRTIQRNLGWLVAEGVIEVNRKGGGRGRSTVYGFSMGWLKKAATVLHESGIAEEYGGIPDLFDLEKGGILAGFRGGNSGSGAAYSSGNGGTDDGNGGIGAAVCAENGGGAGQNSGMGAAVSVEKGGIPGGGRLETAANGPGNSGNFAGNGGRAVPPEESKDIKKRAAADPDRRQGHLMLPMIGGKAGDPAAVNREIDGERRLARIEQRAILLLGDAARAHRAVAWLDEGQKENLRRGLSPSDEDLRKWLKWAEEKAAQAPTEMGAETAAPMPGGLTADILQAIQEATVRAVIGMLPTIIQSIQGQPANEASPMTMAGAL